MRALAIESASRFSSAWVSLSIQCRSSKTTISGWLRLSRSRMRLSASCVRRRLNLRIHLGQRIVALLNSEQRKKVRQRVFQRTIECQYLADHLLAPLRADRPPR